MNVARRLSHVRRAGGLTQRQLAARTGVAQATIARIERGTITPRVDNLERLLQACGRSLEVTPVLGIGVDRSLIRARLAMTVVERSSRGTEEGRALLHVLALRDAATG